MPAIDLILTDMLSLHPFASVTIHLYVPALSLDMVAVVFALGVHK